jgi:hypothetical protein
MGNFLIVYAIFTKQAILIVFVYFYIFIILNTLPMKTIRELNKGLERETNRLKILEIDRRLRQLSRIKHRSVWERIGIRIQRIGLKIQRLGIQNKV